MTMWMMVAVVAVLRFAGAVQPGGAEPQTAPPVVQPTEPKVEVQVVGEPTTVPAGPIGTVAVAPMVVEEGPLKKDSSVAKLLDALYRRGVELKDFEGDVKLSEIDASTGAGSVRAGRVMYDVGEGGATRFMVRFETRAEDDGAPKAEKLVYLLEGAWLTERNYRRKVEIRRQVLRPGQKINLFRLGEGPFPLPIGQDPVEVLKQFSVSKLESEDPRPAIRLIPREGTRLGAKFATIDVWVDVETGFPTRIETLNKQETTVRSTELSGLAVNEKKAKVFELGEVDGEWKRSEEALED